jgi:hypothetical protein
MASANRGDPLSFDLDQRQCQLTPQELDGLRAELESLGPLVDKFPVRRLHISVERHPRNQDFDVKTSLALPGRTLVSFDRAGAWHPAFQNCVANLVEQLHAYTDHMGQVAERAKQEKGTRQTLAPTADPDPAALEAAARDRDYAAFRAATLVYEDGVRLRAGRWVERYPEVAARFGKGLDIRDVVEEVFLNAFEGYDRRPRDVRFGDWLESLIDPAVRVLQAHPERELENISLARSAREAGGRGAV